MKIRIPIVLGLFAMVASAAEVDFNLEIRLILSNIFGLFRLFSPSLHSFLVSLFRMNSCQIVIYKYIFVL